jgi:hypothetical protein
MGWLSRQESTAALLRGRCRALGGLVKCFVGCLLLLIALLLAMPLRVEVLEASEMYQVHC